MTTRIRTSIVAAVALLTIVAAPSGERPGRTPPRTNLRPAMAGAVPIERVVAAVAKRTGKKFIIDPRVRAEVTVVGQEPTSIDYPTLLLILRVHGFAAVEEGGYVHVIPDANMRQYPVPLATGKESYAEGGVREQTHPAEERCRGTARADPAAAAAASCTSGRAAVQEHFADRRHVRQREAHRADCARARCRRAVHAAVLLGQEWPPKQAHDQVS